MRIMRRLHSGLRYLRVIVLSSVGCFLAAGPFFGVAAASKSDDVSATTQRKVLQARVERVRAALREDEAKASGVGNRLAQWYNWDNWFNGGFNNY
jgi:hypothetical protein